MYKFGKKINNEISVNYPCIQSECTGLTIISKKGELMKRLFLSLVLLISFFTMAYSQYAESFFTSNPNYKEELEKNGSISFAIPATVNYKPLGVINWSEGFEATTFPPTGWSVHQLDGGSNTWIRFTTSPIFGTASASVRWESATLPNDDWLVTHQFLVNPGAFLNFYAKGSTTFRDSVEILVSTTGGTPPSGFTRIAAFRPTTTQLFQVSLNDYANQNVYVAFRYKETNQLRLYVDSVYVETPVALDAGVSAILQPGTIHTTLGTIPSIVVKNFGLNPTGTFQAHLMIEPGGYHQLLNVSSLNSGEADTLEFPAWTPPTKGTYQVLAYTTLSGDLNPQNDSLQKSVSVTEELYRDFIHNVSMLYPGGISLYGAEFDGTYFYVTKWNENKIYRINKQVTSIDSFTISGLSATSGLRDLAWDGQYLYGSTATTTVYRLDISTFTATTAFTSPVSVRGIAYDAANDAFWVSNWNTNLVLVSRTGATLQTITAASHRLTGMSGLAYDTLTSGGPYIWVLDGGTATAEKILYKFQASSGAKVDSFLITQHLPPVAIGGGVFVTDQAYTGSITLGVFNQSTPHLITGYKIGSVTIQANVTLLHPNGGEQFVTNRKEIIVWKSQNLTGNVNLLISSDGGSSWQPLASNIPNTGFYSTTTPSTPMTNMLMKIESVDNPTVFDVSDGTFDFVEGPQPQVEFPVVVTDGFFSQTLKMGLDPSATDGIDSALGEFELPPIPPSTVFDARLIGTDIGLPQLGQGVVKDFRTGSSTFNGQKIHEVKCQRGPLARVTNSGITLYWSLPANVTGRLQDLVTGNIIDVQMVGDDSYTVTNPDLSDKLKITYTYSTPPVGDIKVLYPNGGEVLRRGSNVLLAWKSDIGGLVNIFYSTDGGTNYTLIEDSIPNSGVWGSQIGFDNPEGTQWKMKIQSVESPSIFDESDGTFTIQGTKLVYLDNPFVISDGQSSVGLMYGLDPSATDGLDPALGEAELPPLPPTGVFDGRFVGTDIGIPQLGQGTLKDYRQGNGTFSGNKIHEIQYQMGSGDSLRLFWYLPSNVTGLLQDFFGGSLVNVTMVGAGNFTVPNPGILNKLKITLTYTPEPATVQVVQPNGGENLIVGQSYQIVWNATGISNVKLQYTTDGGASWFDIATVPARTTGKVRLENKHPKDPNAYIEGNLGTYNWTVPNTPSNQCKVRVSDAANPSTYDESDNFFTISAPMTEGWIVQSSGTTAALYSVSAVNENVAWACGAGGVVIRTTNGGSTWTTVTSPRAVDAHVICGIDANKALVATNGTADAKIHLTTNGGQTWQDVYTVAGGFINVLIMFDDMNGFAQGDPVGGNWVLLKTTDGGSTWTSAATLPQAGTEYGWNNSGWRVGDNLWFGTNNTRVYKSTDRGATWSYAPTTIINSYSIAFGNAQKGVVGSATGTANRSTDGGNSWASIVTPATGNILGMTSVSENEYWFTSNTNVYYTGDQGTNWSTSFTGSAALYHLHFKGLGGQNVVGYAVGANGYLVKYFRGPVTPQVVVVSPNGGENWPVGSTRQIVWNAQAIQNVKLEYSTNNGSTWNYIATVPALSKSRIDENSETESVNRDLLGVYNWTIPNTPSNQCLVKVSDASNPAVFDVSDNVFTISTAVPGIQLQFNYDISALAPGIYSVYGSEFDGQYFYLTRWNEPKIFRVNKSGTQIDSFNVTGLPTGGFRDLAFDGQYLYGSNNSTTVYQIDRNTFTATAAFTSPVAVRGISYDAANDAFWVANWNTNINLVNRSGVTLYTIPASQHGLTGMSGNAYDTLSPGGPYLWIFSGGTVTDPKVLWKINPTNGQRIDSINVTDILPAGAIGGGLWITDQFESGTVTLGGSSQAVPHRLFGFKIHQIGPVPGTVTVLSPNGGEVFYKGQWQLITWKSYEFDNRVRIKVSQDGGLTYFELVSNVPNNGVFAFYVPNDAQLGDNFKIRIEAQTDSTKFDESDSVFSVAAAPYTLPVVDLPMIISDDERSRLLRFGLDPAASDSIDTQFGEEELPPLPPAGVLDARFIGDDIGLSLGQGLAYDYRSGRTNVPSIKVHELKFQKGSGDVIVINLYLPADVTVRFESFVPGFDTTVSGVARVVVTDSMINKLKMTLNYFPGSALGTFNLFGPINNALITARQNDSTSITFRWYKARNAIAYRLRMGVPAIPPFMLDSLSNNSGTDSTFTIRQYELFNIFNQPTYPTDTTVIGQWAVWAYGAAGDSVRSNSVYSIRLRLVRFLDVDDAPIPTDFVVYQNYPNPFNPSTKIKFGLPEDAMVTVEVFNIVGEKVATLISENMRKGYHEISFNASGLQSGVYFYKVNAGKFSTVKKMLLIK